ncbi:MAG TPA: PilZ domain-containing protein [Steroidobacteraceae bacterium]|nr:PilZ domain-containing protein [Steroidobacteraceae bacterium]
MGQSANAQMASQPRPAFMEHRWGQRMRCLARVRLSAGAENTGAGRVRDVSSSGAYIETSFDIPVHARVTLLVQGNESSTRVVEIAASVARRDREGIGVEWCDTPGCSICVVLGCTTPCAASKET